MDLSALDHLEILEVVFPVVYAPYYFPDPYFSSDMPVHSIEVEAGIKINCGFWASDKQAPSLLYFHGNGETAASHDLIAPFYNQRGLNLFVADYRGYGSSDGKPTISNMLSDAHIILKSFKEILQREGFEDSLFLMGRSLGSMPAVELAFSHQDEIRGLIIESGAANNLRRLWEYLDIAEKEALLDENSLFLNKVKIRQIQMPTLIIHGENDQIIPVTEAEELYRNSGAQNKKILVIPGADHNDVLIVQPNLYFGAIESFVKAYS